MFVRQQWSLDSMLFRALGESGVLKRGADELHCNSLEHPTETIIGSRNKDVGSQNEQAILDRQTGQMCFTGSFPHVGLAGLAGLWQHQRTLV